MFVGVQGRLTPPQPLDYGAVQGMMTALCGRYACLRRVAVGRSELGREVTALVLGRECRRRVLMVSALGAQEWLTALCVLRLCEEIGSHLRAQLPLCDVSLSRALDGRQVWFLPLPNPDGVEIARYGSGAAGAYAATAAQLGADVPGLWRGNARGVDITSHFTAGWEELQPPGQKNGENCDETAPWTAEARTIAHLCRRVPFHYGVVLGGGGAAVDWWRGAATPSRSRLMAQVLAAVSGYAVTPPTEPPTEDFAHWFIHVFRRPALTLRLGEGPCPLPLREFEGLYAAVREMLLLSLLF